MKAKILFFFLVASVISGAMGQSNIDLTFTAVDNTAYIRLDSIKIMNRTQGDSVMLSWPDTTLTYHKTPGDLLLFIGYAIDYPVGIGTISKKEQQFQLFPNYPNPVRDESIISLYLPAKGAMDMMVSDVRGRIVETFTRELEKGPHSFKFRPGDEQVYFITVRWHGSTQSIKILTEGQVGGKTCKLEYIGHGHENPPLKQSQHKSGLVVQESGILDTPEANSTYIFQFATNIPCLGTPTVTCEGQVYNTIQIFSQCWLKENLNVGTMINGTQGICPPGWHLPTDEEWKVLEGAVDSLYGIGCTEWDLPLSYRGYDAGKNLKTTSGWYVNGNGADRFGFSGLPGGRYIDGLFSYVGSSGFWWSSTECGLYNTWGRSLYYGITEVSRSNDYKRNGFSARCLRDY